MSDRAPVPGGLRRASHGLALVAIVLGLAAFVGQGLAAWRAAGVAPGVAVTSGSEEESHFAIWRAMRGLEVYGDQTRLPFAAAYFNWLFYAAYGHTLQAISGGEDEGNFIRLGRLLTAAGSLAGAAVFFRLLRPAARGAEPLLALVAMSVFLGPAVGWWAHTMRPDVWALVFEGTALAAFLHWHRARPWPATFAALVLTYAAWSYKQTYLGGLATMVLFLAHRRQWTRAAALALGSATLWGATFLALGPAYRAAQVSTAMAGEYRMLLGVENLVDFSKRGAPLILLALAVLAATFRRVPPATPEPPLAADSRRLGGLGLLVTVPLAFAGACRFGASSYYFFSAALMLGFIIAGGAGRAAFPLPALPGLSAAAGLHLALLLGFVGHLELAEQTNVLAERWAAWRNQPEPRFSHDRRLNLPWLNPHSPPLVLAFNYDYHLRARTGLEAGGVGGLIESGFFASLLLPDHVNDAALGGKLDRYIAGETVTHMTIYRRKPGSAPR